MYIKRKTIKIILYILKINLIFIINTFFYDDDAIYEIKIDNSKKNFFIHLIKYLIK